MTKISKKMKSIYILLAMVLVCACMLIMPTTKAVNSATPAAAQKLRISAVQVSVDTVQSRWALMFKAEIDTASFDELTNNGGDSVVFGMLIGPTWKLDGVTDYDSAIAASFKSFSHVGTQRAVNKNLEDDCIQVISPNENGSAVYYAGVTFDASQISQGTDLQEVTQVELTAIPYYIKSDETHVLLDNAKVATPRNTLVESYIREQVAGINNIRQEDVNAYAGTITLDATNEYYICKSTNRLYYAAAKTEGTNYLVKKDLDIANTSKLYVAGQDVNPVDVNGNLDTTQLDPSAVAGLTSADKYVGLVEYKQDGTIKAYAAKIAERVIMRLLNWTKYAETDAPATEDADWLYSGTFGQWATYKSILYTDIKLNSYYGPYYWGRPAEQEINGGRMLVATSKVDGFYVLGMDIMPYNGVPYALISKYWGNRNFKMLANEGYGFVGTFDGRGKYIMTERYDGVYEAHTIAGGIFPTASNATIKNLGFVLTHTYDGTDSTTAITGALFQGAINTTFENIYVKVKSVDNAPTSTSGHAETAPIIGSIENCTVKNFIIEADCRIETDATATSAGAGKQYDSMLAFHTHSNGHYSNESYYDDSGHYKWSMRPALAGNSVDNLFAVGSSTLFVQQEMNDNNTILAKAMYLVNPDSPLAPTEGDVTDYITRADLEALEDGAEKDAKLAEFDKYAALATTHKQFLHTKAVADEFLATNPLKIRFLATAGAHDFTAAEMTAYVKNANNAEALARFDSKYWNVNTTNGTITFR